MLMGIWLVFFFSNLFILLLTHVCMFIMFVFALSLQLLAYKDYRPKELPIVDLSQEVPIEEQGQQNVTPVRLPPKKDGPSPSSPPVLLPPPPPPQLTPLDPNVPDVNGVALTSPTDPSDQEVKWLWDYACDLTEGKNISCMCWNKVLGMN